MCLVLVQALKLTLSVPQTDYFGSQQSLWIWIIGGSFPEILGIDTDTGSKAVDSRFLYICFDTRCRNRKLTSVPGIESRHQESTSVPGIGIDIGSRNSGIDTVLGIRIDIGLVTCLRLRVTCILTRCNSAVRHVYSVAQAQLKRKTYALPARTVHTTS